MMLPPVTRRNLTPKVPGFFSDISVALRSFAASLRKPYV